jgi:hypothetical protein
MSKILNDTHSDTALVADIKAAVKLTTWLTGEFVQAIIEDAELTRAKSCKSPKKLLELWMKRELPLASLRHHLKVVAAKAPAKPEKPAKVKKVLAESETPKKRGRPKKDKSLNGVLAEAAAIQATNCAAPVSMASH